MEKKKWKYLSIGLLLLAIPLLVLSVFPVNVDLIDADTYQTSFSPTNLEITELREEFEKISPTLSVINQNPLGWEDQMQTILGGWVRIGIWQGLALGQIIANDRDYMLGFDVLVARHNTPIWPLYIGIMHPDPFKELHVDNFKFLYSISADALPEADTFYWIDLGPFLSNICADEDVLIVLFSLDFPIPPDTYWKWGACNEDPYAKGRCYQWNGDEWTTEGISSNLDTCFITYTEIQSPPPDPPLITITSTYNVIAQVMGILTLLGAVISGTKYFTVV